jgi:hypothetical protein
MVSIESRVTNEKEWGLSFLMKMLTEAQELNDDVQAKKIAKRALEQAKRQGNGEWEAKFQAILDEYPSNIKFEENSNEEPKALEGDIVTDLTPYQKLKEQIPVTSSPKPKLKRKVNTIESKLTDWGIKPSKKSPTVIKDSQKVEMVSHYGEDSKDQQKSSEPKDVLERNVPKIEVQIENLNEEYPEEEISPTIQEEMEEVLSIEESRKELKDDDILIPQKNRFMEDVDLPPLKIPIFSSKRTIVDVEEEPEHSQIQSEFLSKDVETRSRIPYREQWINTLPNAEQLLQRQQSAQKILEVIREAGMIEIPMNKPELREIFRAVDLLACKAMRGENGRCIILLVPIKHVITTDPVYVWDSHVMTGQINANPTTAQNMAINTHTKKLLQASEYMFSDMINGRSLISLVARYIGILMKTNLTFKNKRLYLGSGEIEYQVIIDPVLQCDTRVYCMEKTLPYAYQQASNLHVVSHDQLEEVLRYLELKYRLLIHHNTSQNAIMKVNDAKISTFKQLQLISLPFLAYGVLFSFFLILGIQGAVRFCISLGFGLIFVYGGFLGYLLYRHFQSLKNIGSEFSIPYHQKSIELTEEDFILINEQLSSQWMTQFSYEVENHQNPSYQKRVKCKKYQANTSDISSLPVNEKKLSKIIPENRKTSDYNPVLSKYQTFLDD